MTRQPNSGVDQAVVATLQLLLRLCVLEVVLLRMSRGTVLQRPQPRWSFCSFAAIHVGSDFGAQASTTGAQIQVHAAPPPLSVVAQSAGQPVLGIQGDRRNRAKLTLVLHVVLCMDRFAKVRENLHQGGLKLGRLLAMGHGTAASNSQTQHCMKRAIAAKKHA